MVFNTGWTVHEWIWVSEVKVIVWPLSKSLKFILSNICSQAAGQISQISCGAFMIRGQNFLNDVGHMTKMAARPMQVNDLILQEIFLWNQMVKMVAFG